MTSGQQKAVVGAMLLLVATIAWNSYQTQQAVERMSRGADKLETAAKIYQESDDCVSRCPSYKTGDYSNGNYRPPDNSDHEKCLSVCTGEQRQKFRALLK